MGVGPDTARDVHDTVIGLLTSLLFACVWMVLHSQCALGQTIMPGAPKASESTLTPKAFEVASIRPHDADFRPTFSRTRFDNDEFNATNTLVQTLIVYAYDLRDPVLKLRSSLIPGGPKWIQSDWYDIHAKISESDLAELRKLSPAQQDIEKRAMVKTLLADRFMLKVHKVVNDVPAYKLVIAKNGPRNMKLKPDSDTESIRWNGPGHGEYTSAPLSLLLSLLENLLRCPVIDATGLTGKYDFALNWARDPSTMPPGELSDDSEPEIFSALQEQLGLKLVPVKAPVESVVIDQIVRPSPN